MAPVYFAASTLLAASLLGLTYSHPLDITTRPDLSLLPSQDLSPADGWADPIWEIPGLKGPRILYYNAGPCVNNKTIPGHTFTNGTVADATLISIFEDYNAAFKTNAGRKNAIDTMLAEWQPLDKLSIPLSKTPTIESRDIVVRHSAEELSLARRQTGGPSDTDWTGIVRHVNLVFGFMFGGAALGYALAHLGTDNLSTSGALSPQRRNQIKGVLMICFAMFGSALYHNIINNQDVINARYAALMAMIRAQVRGVVARLNPAVEIDPSEVSEVIEDIETGRVSVSDVASEMPEGLSDGQDLVQDVEMTRQACPRPSDPDAS